MNKPILQRSERGTLDREGTGMRQENANLWTTISNATRSGWVRAVQLFRVSLAALSIPSCTFICRFKLELLLGLMRGDQDNEINAYVAHQMLLVLFFSLSLLVVSTNINMASIFDPIYTVPIGLLENPLRPY